MQKSAAVQEFCGKKWEENVKEEATFVDDLSADSLDIVELVMNIEEEFEMEMPDGDADKIVTVGDVVEYIKEHK